jgi:hypothetical protein
MRRREDIRAGKLFEESGACARIGRDDITERRERRENMF